MSCTLNTIWPRRPFVFVVGVFIVSSSRFMVGIHLNQFYFFRVVRNHHFWPGEKKKKNVDLDYRIGGVEAQSGKKRSGRTFREKYKDHVPKQLCIIPISKPKSRLTNKGPKSALVIFFHDFYFHC